MKGPGNFILENDHSYSPTKFTDVGLDVVKKHFERLMRVAAIKNFAQFTGKDGKPYYVIQDNGINAFQAYHFTGHGMEKIGFLYLTLVDKETQTYTPDAGKSFAVHINDEYRRKGIASALYDYAEHLGYNVVPSTLVHTGAKGVWKKRKGIDLEQEGDYPDFFDNLANPLLKDRPYPKIANLNQAPLSEEARFSKKKKLDEPTTQYLLNKMKMYHATYLGSGLFGDAYEFNGKVVKFTTDIKEVRMAQQLSKKKFKHIAEIYKLMRFQQENGEILYIIIMEKLEPLDEQDYRIFRTYEKAGSSYIDFKYQSDENLSFEQALKNIDNPKIAEYFNDFVIRDIKLHINKILWISEQVEELKKEVSQVLPANDVQHFLTDFHSTNVGKKTNGELAFFDLRWMAFMEKPKYLRRLHENKISQDELEKKSLPYKYANLIDDFIVIKTEAEIREIAPSINLRQEPVLVIKQMEQKYPELFDNFAEWIHEKIHGQVSLQEEPEKPVSKLDYIKEKIIPIVQDKFKYDIKFIGSGSKGWAFEISPDKIFKITPDAMEYENALKLIQQPDNKYFVQYYSAKPLKDKVLRGYYSLVMEKLAPITDRESDIIDNIMQTLGTSERMLDTNRVLGYLSEMRRDPELLEYLQTNMDELKKLVKHLQGIYLSAKRIGIPIYDLRSTNIGKDKDGNLVHFDLGNG